MTFMVSIFVCKCTSVAAQIVSCSTKTLHAECKMCVTFLSQPAVACNPELFPISHYFITIPSLEGNLTVPAVDTVPAVESHTHKIKTFIYYSVSCVHKDFDIDCK